MRADRIARYCCPAARSRLSVVEGDNSVDIVSGRLRSEAGREYLIISGVPHLLFPAQLDAAEISTQADYDRMAGAVYDRSMTWQFAAFLENEDAVREGMVDLLELEPGMRVLETGCGTGRDSFRLAHRIPGGELELQDISTKMVAACVDTMRQHEFSCEVGFAVANANWLPFPDSSFDAVFHFGGCNGFSDLKGAVAEMNRVAKEGARIVYGDEAVAPWLKGTEFEGIVCANNPLFKADTPFASLPVGARDVSVRWVIGNCFYVIAFTKGVGSPPLDLDLPHVGIRGGSMRSRYFGVLEGVRPETKALVREAATKAGLSMHEWLERVIASAAKP
jgi:SAM-dependent methyltransferase